MTAFSKSQVARQGLYGLLLLAAVFAAYQPAWRAGWIWDDDVYVTNNRLLAASDGLSRIWLSRDSPSQYFPLTYTVLRAEHSLWGLHSSGYHCVNILLHSLNAVLLWRLLRRLEIPGAWFGAAIFALHPVNVESVAWVTEVKNILSLLFYLLSLRAWVEFVAGGRARYYVFALAACALALFSKTTACTLPAALVLTLWLMDKRVDARRWLQIGPFVAVCGAMGLVSIWWERFHQYTVGAAFQIAWPDRFIIASQALWFYAGKFLCPANLTFIYPKWPIDAHHALDWIWPAITLACAAALFVCRHFVPRGVMVVLVFYVAALSPLLGFVMEFTFKYTFVADHYQYIAIIAPCALAAAVLNRGLLRYGARGCVAFRAARVVLLLSLGVLTWRQSRVYADSETLWRANVARNPDAAISHNNLAAALLDKSDFAGAISESQIALALEPESAHAQNNLGLALLREHRVDDAIPHLRQAAALDPGNPNPPYNLGQAMLAKNNFPEAASFFKRAIALDHNYADAYCNLGFALLQLGRVDDAIPEYREALEINPDYALAHNDLGGIYLRQRRLDEALAHFQRATQILPNFAEAQCNLGEVLLLMGRRDDAFAHFQAAVRSHPGFPPAVRRLRELSTQ